MFSCLTSATNLDIKRAAVTDQKKREVTIYNSLIRKKVNVAKMLKYMYF